MAVLSKKLLQEAYKFGSPSLLGFFLSSYLHDANIIYLYCFFIINYYYICCLFSAMKLNIVSIFLLASCLMLNDCIASPIQYKYEEHVRLEQNKIVSLHFIIANQQLPYPIRKLIATYNTSLRIIYGNYYHHTYNLNNERIDSNSITAILKGSFVPIQLKETIQSLFMFSLQSRYSCYFSDLHSLVFNDPNDKFCTHHIEQIVRNFLPCGFHSGISQLLDVDTFFNGNRVYGMEVNWEESKMEIQIQIQLTRKLEGLKKIKISEKCLKQSLLTIADANKQIISQRQNVLVRYIQSLNQNQVKNETEQYSHKMLLSRSLEGNWYYIQKTLRWQLNWENASNISVIILRQILPAFVTVKSIQVINMYNSSAKANFQYHCDSHTNKYPSKYGETNLICVLRLKMENYFEFNERNSYQILWHLQNKLTNFDLYQSIFGGGIELPIMPINLELINPSNSDLRSQKIIKYNSQSISLRTPQPDQALPFQVITFGVGVFGYLWLAVWRKFSNDMKMNLQN